MDEFERIRAFSVELGKKTEEAVAAETAATTEKSEEPTEEAAPNADFLENWAPTNEPVSATHNLSKTFWLVSAGVILLLIALIGVIYLLLKGPIDNEEVVTITPTQKATKVRPENPGGMVIPDQDKVIYSRLTQDTIPAKVEKMFPEEEEPVMPKVVETPADPEINPLEVEEDVQIIEVPEIEAVKPTQKPVPVVKEEKPVIAAVKQPQKAEWKVQLFSSTDKAKVEKQWQEISKKQKALVSDMPMQIVPASIPGKGTFYRLQLGAFETRQMAVNLCAKLKKHKQECIPAK